MCQNIPLEKNVKRRNLWELPQILFANVIESEECAALLWSNVGVPTFCFYGKMNVQKKTAELTLRTTESDRKRKTLSVLKAKSSRKIQ
ncbi:Uncharacterized protein XB17_00692 [Leptospira santarosai]|nr:Uncharacterized protein XB17_00692 [Leptospira santarosai]